jgi:hypothetical protein
MPKVQTRYGCSNQTTQIADWILLLIEFKINLEKCCQYWDNPSNYRRSMVQKEIHTKFNRVKSNLKWFILSGTP